MKLLLILVTAFALGQAPPATKTEQLQDAARKGDAAAVKMLLDEGVDLAGKDTFYGFTPLMLAVSPARKKTPAHTEIARLLIAKGAPGKDMALNAAVDDDDDAFAKVVL